MKLPTQSKFIVLAWIILFIISLLIVHNTPTAGWESSIYTSTPGIYWLSLLLGYIIGTFLIVRNLFNSNPNTSEKKLGFCVLSLNSLSLVSLWIIKGYFALNLIGDTGTHLGNLIGTVSLGFTGDSYYPLGYVSLALDQIALGISSLDIFAYYPIFFYGAFIIGMYFLTKYISNNETAATISAIISLYLPLGSAPYLGAAAQYIHHTYQAELLLPLIFYFILKATETSNGKRYFVLSLVGMLFSIFYHPIAGMIVGLFIVSCLLYTVFPSIKSKNNITYKVRTLLSLFLALAISYVLWIWKYYGGKLIDGIFSIFQNIFMGSDGEATGLSIASTLDAGLSYGYSLDTILQMFGIELILLLFAGIGALKTFHSKTDAKINNMKLWLFFSIVMVALACALMVSSFMVGIGRLSTLIPIITIVFSGYAIYEIVRDVRSRCNKKYIIRYGHVLLSIILVITCILSVYSFYPSPNTLRVTPQTEATEYHAAETLLPLIEHSYSIEIPVISFSLYRYADIFYTQNSGERFIGVTVDGSEYAMKYYYDSIASLPAPPYHFNYHIQNTYHNETSEPSYLIITDKAKRYYVEHYGNEIGLALQEEKFSEVDLKHVDSDSSLIRVYSNGAFNLYFTSLL